MINLFKRFKKGSQPFDAFYRKVTPEIFVYLFQKELVQTIAFILSFCKSKKFIRKVLQLINNEEVTEQVANYLSYCKDVDFDAFVCKDVERWCDIMVAKYNEGVITQAFRANVKNILPKNLKKETDILCALDEPIQKMITHVNKMFKEFETVVGNKESIIKIDKTLDALKEEQLRLQKSIREIKDGCYDIRRLFASNDDAAEEKIDAIIEKLEKNLEGSIETTKLHYEQRRRLDFPSLIPPSVRFPK